MTVALKILAISSFANLDDFDHEPPCFSVIE